MTNTPSKQTDTPTRHPDCVTEVRMSNTVLTVFGHFKQHTAADKMAKVLEVESRCQQLLGL